MNVSGAFYVGPVTDALADFDRRPLSFHESTYDVFVAGQGPAVLILPEIPGLTPDIADFARREHPANQGHELVLEHLRQKLQTA